MDGEDKRDVDFYAHFVYQLARVSTANEYNDSQKRFMFSARYYTF